MAESGELFGLGDTIAKLMKSPEIANIVSSFAENSANAENTENPAEAATNSTNAENPQSPSTLGSFNLTPEMMAKLPAMISAISSMGIDPGKILSGANTGEAPKKEEKKEISSLPIGDKKRRALLTSLRPYLSQRRQGIIDGMLKIENLTGIIGTISSVIPKNSI